MENHKHEEEKAPLFKSWIGWYALILGNLAFLIVLFYFFGELYK